MSFFEVYSSALLLLIGIMTVLWLISIPIKNVSIVDPFWGSGFVILTAYYFYSNTLHSTRQYLVLGLCILWGLRLTIYLLWRNAGKGEDFRYKTFRNKYGAKRYWWFSFFQVFLLQGILLWIISSPLLAVQYYAEHPLGWMDLLASIIWLTGFLFESIGDYQMVKFKMDNSNKGKVLNTGLWKFTRHPNYFGDACVWWSFGLFALAAGSYWTLLGSLLMTYLLLKISGVSLLERTLKTSKPLYDEYIRKTNSFIPWFPKQ